MLRRLTISNYALISEIDIEFSEGFNVITGETGAGKSIILGALRLIMGERADARVVTDRDRRSVIEATFDVTALSPGLRDYCQANDIEWDDREMILRREVTVGSNGRSRAFINDSPVPVSKLQGVSEQLVDIHSQNRNQLLGSADFQLNVIDSMADNQELLRQYREQFEALRGAVTRLKKARAMTERERREEDYLRHCLKQFHALQLTQGEQERLESRRDALVNAEAYKSKLAEAVGIIDDDSAERIALLSGLDQLTRRLEELQPILPEEEGIPVRVVSMRADMADVLATLSSLRDTFEADPGELEQLDSRLTAIYTLQRRYGVDTVDALLDIQRDMEHRLAAIENSEERLERLTQAASAARDEALVTAKAITETRRRASEQLARELRDTAMPLGMNNLVVDIRLETAEMTATGIDRVDFLFAFNKNQEPMSVAGVASGGETSRLMLSLKSLIARKMQLPTIIFDEVDTGVSGDIATRMGAMMRAMAEGQQVIAITHLPQVAAAAGSHYRVYKADDEHSTHTYITRLDASGRLTEIATMLSGNNPGAEALANARSLIDNAK